MIDQGYKRVTLHNFANMSAILGQILTIFRQKMMESWLATKSVSSSYLKNIGQVHHLHISLYLRYYTNDC